MNRFITRHIKSVAFAIFSLIALALCSLSGSWLTASPPSQYQYPFQNPALPIEERITNILSLMTLDEKIACLGTDPSVPRLGIKGSHHVEGIHGLAQGGPAKLAT